MLQGVNGAETGWTLVNVLQKMGMEVMVTIGLVWGTTNALIKRGALISEEKNKKRKLSLPTKRRSGFGWLIDYIEHWIGLLCVWQYSIPFIVNLSASVGFFSHVGGHPNLPCSACHQCGYFCSNSSGGLSSVGRGYAC